MMTEEKKIYWTAPLIQNAHRDRKAAGHAWRALYGVLVQLASEETLAVWGGVVTQMLEEMLSAGQAEAAVLREEVEAYLVAIGMVEIEANVPEAVGECAHWWLGRLLPLVEAADLRIKAAGREARPAPRARRRGASRRSR